MVSSGTLRHVALVRTNVSEELSASFIRVTLVFLRSLCRLLDRASVVPSSPILVTLMKQQQQTCIHFAILHCSPSCSYSAYHSDTWGRLRHVSYCNKCIKVWRPGYQEFDTVVCPYCHFNNTPAMGSRVPTSWFGAHSMIHFTEKLTYKIYWALQNAWRIDNYACDILCTCLPACLSVCTPQTFRMKNNVFWDVTQRGSYKSRRFGVTYCLNLFSTCFGC
jgi:hypothetical protein